MRPDLSYEATQLRFQTQVKISDSELLYQRKNLTEIAPSLPQRASKAFAIMYSAFRDAFEQANGDELIFRRVIANHAQPSAQSSILTEGNRQPSRIVTVRPVARPIIDSDQLAKAAIEFLLQDPEIAKTLRVHLNEDDYPLDETA